jgi:hypothetical protein
MLKNRPWKRKSKMSSHRMLALHKTFKQVYFEAFKHIFWSFAVIDIYFFLSSSIMTRMSPFKVNKWAFQSLNFDHAYYMQCSYSPTEICLHGQLIKYIFWSIFKKIERIVMIDDCITF